MRELVVELRASGAKLEQGDLIRVVPSVYVKSPSYMVKVGKNNYALRPAKPKQLDVEKSVEQENVREFLLELEEGEQDMLAMDEGDRHGNAVGARRLGMVLSHGCEIDKETRYPMITMVQVRPLTGVHEKDRESITTYTQKRTFYLPPSKFLPDAHYADFRFLTTIRQSVIDELPRVASLNEDGRALLNFQYFRFHARKRLPDDWIEWPDETEEEDGGA